MSNPSRHAVLATLDTKGEEVAFLESRLRAHGGEAHIVDVGVMGEPSLAAAVPRDEVARLGGADLEELRAARDPGQAMRVMASGARAVLAQLVRRDQLGTVIGIAGGKGTALFDSATAELPVTTPKILVSSARAEVLAHVASKPGVVAFPTVVDLMGLNRFTRVALTGAALLAAAPRESGSDEAGTTVAVTSFGVTTAAAMACVERLRALGLESLVLPANGSGGRLLERLIAEGQVDAVLDITTTEIADELVGGLASAGDRRLRAAGEAAIPHLVAPGAVDMVNFGPPDTVPKPFRERLLYRHSDLTTLMRTTAEENRKIGATTAERVSAGSGPRCIVWPSKGVSDYDQPGRVFFDRDADRAWLEGARTAAGDVEVVTLDCHINDPAFAEHAVRWLSRQLAAREIVA